MHVYLFYKNILSTIALLRLCDYEIEKKKKKLNQTLIPYFFMIG